MRNQAVDFSWTHPSAAELVDANCDAIFYTGNARPDKSYVDSLRAAGVGVCLVQETDPNRSQQGNLAGHADAIYADNRADQIGYPLTASICYVVSDGSRDFPNTGADQIAAYAAGVIEASRRPVFWYGNQYACVAAMRSGGLGTWIPSTWGDGSLLTQEANQASPIANTDLNTVHAPYGNWTDDAPTPEDDLTPEQAAALDEVHGILTGGGQYPSLEARIEDAVNKHVDKAVADALAVQVHPTLNLAGKVGIRKLTGTATP